jgi:hypothetical protein
MFFSKVIVRQCAQVVTIITLVFALNVLQDAITVTALNAYNVIFHTVLIATSNAQFVLTVIFSILT